MIQSSIKQYFPKPISKPWMSKNTKTLFNTLIGRLYTGTKSWKDIEEYITESEIEYLKYSEFIKNQAASHIPEEIRSIIVKQSVYQKVYLIHVEKREYKVALTYPITMNTTVSQKNVETYFTDSIKKIYLWLYLVAPYISIGCSESTNIYVFFTEHRKMIASTKRTPLGEIHVNTAFTTSCKKDTDIHIYRKEEWFKVFIHETFHNMGLDFSAMDDTVSNEIILANFPINAPQGIRLYESYCEIWAEMMNILFIVFDKTKEKDKTNHKQILENIDKMVRKEMVFSIFQCVKILKHYNMTYNQLTNVDCPISKKYRTQYKESSYILSYYIAKSILFSQPDKFFDWCKRSNPNIIGFLNTPDNISNYANFIVNESKNEIFMKYVQDFEKIIPQIPETDPILKTLRMTIYE